MSGLIVLLCGMLIVIVALGVVAWLTDSIGTNLLVGEDDDPISGDRLPITPELREKAVAVQREEGE